MNFAAGPNAIVDLDFGSRFEGGCYFASLRQFLFPDQVLAIVCPFDAMTSHFEFIPQAGRKGIPLHLRLDPGDFSIDHTVVVKSLGLYELEPELPGEDADHDQCYCHHESEKMQENFHRSYLLGLLSKEATMEYKSSRLSGNGLRLNLFCVPRRRKLKFFAGVMACSTLGGCFPTARDGAVVDPDVRPPEAIVAECALCHSTKEAQRGPILHGMDEWYLLDQTQKFRAGARGQNPDNRSEYLMGAAVRKIRNDQEMKALAKWFAEQEPMPAVRTVQGNLETGATLYALRCASCHGENAEGKREPLSPSLTKLEGWYFMDQMRKYSNGLRGKHASDTSGQVMAAAVVDLSKRQLQDVVAYVVDAFGPPEAPSLRQRFEKRALESNASKK